MCGPSSSKLQIWKRSSLRSGFRTCVCIWSSAAFAQTGLLWSWMVKLGLPGCCVPQQLEFGRTSGLVLKLPLVVKGQPSQAGTIASLVLAPLPYLPPQSSKSENEHERLARREIVNS